MKTTILIASPFRASNTEVENAHNSIMASQLLVTHLAAPLQTAVGSYKEEGQDKASIELSFVMPVPENSIGAVVSLFHNTYQQDSVIAVNPVDFSTHLIHRDGTLESVGIFQVISEEEAKVSECYTFWRNQYWLAK